MGQRGHLEDAGQDPALPQGLQVVGRMHAEEVGRGLPTSVAVACADAAAAAWVQETFGTDRFRVYTNADLVTAVPIQDTAALPTCP